jgi:hypothetical protein
MLYRLPDPPPRPSDLPHSVVGEIRRNSSKKLKMNTTWLLP